MNVHVHSLAYDVTSMVEFKEFVVNFERKEQLGAGCPIIIRYLF